MSNMIFLYIIMFGYNSAQINYRIPMPDMKTCQQNISMSKSKISIGSEAEMGFIQICGSDIMQTRWKAKWYTIKEKTND